MKVTLAKAFGTFISCEPDANCPNCGLELYTSNAGDSYQQQTFLFIIVTLFKTKNKTVMLKMSDTARSEAGGGRGSASKFCGSNSTLHSYNKIFKTTNYLKRD